MTKDEATARSAMKLALEALKQIEEAMPFPVAKLAQAALREALAQERSSDEQPAQQEPVGKIVDCDFVGNSIARFERHLPFGTLLYTSPPAQRTWVGLTDEEIEQSCVPLGAAMLSFTEVARAIEAKLKEKNSD